MDRWGEVISEAIEGLRLGGLGAVREFTWRTYLRYARRMDPEPVFEADWDLLVVLDACRADVWTEVAAGTEDFPIGTARVGPAGTSTEWLSAVFGDREPAELADVGYVTGNPYSEEFVPGGDMGQLEEVWRYAWEDDIGTVPPRPVTDAAVRVGRETDIDRLIVHYMQPHFPSLAGEWEEGTSLESFGEESLGVWNDLRSGTRSVQDAWRAYRENLKLVLPDVSLLCSNVDAPKTVVTADHGNAFGERGLYGHAEGIALRAMREVPWVETTATDRRTYEPTSVPERVEPSTDGDGVQARLRQLGYT